MIPTILALLVALIPLAQEAPPAAFPREGAKQLIDNERVTVWDVTWEKGKPTGTHQYVRDVVSVDLEDATTRMMRDGRTDIKTVLKGRATFIEQGALYNEECITETPRHAIVIELKDIQVPPLANKSGHPDAFPRSGAKKLLDNPKVVVWDYSWTPGKPTATHFHTKDVVVVYLGDGDLESKTPDGKKTLNSYKFGQAKFNPRDRTHSELLVKGTQRVIAVELK